MNNTKEKIFLFDKITEFYSNLFHSHHVTYFPVSSVTNIIIKNTIVTLKVCGYANDLVFHFFFFFVAKDFVEFCYLHSNFYKS